MGKRTPLQPPVPVVAPCGCQCELRDDPNFTHPHLVVLRVCSRRAHRDHYRFILREQREPPATKA